MVLLIEYSSPTRHRQMVNTVRGSEYYKKLKACRFELVIQRVELTGQPIILEQVIRKYFINIV